MCCRISGSLLSAQALPDGFFLVTCGVGKHPPSEASAMASLLQDAGTAPEGILLDESSVDTLESVRNRTRILKSLPEYGDVIVCSDIYRNPWCRWLFMLIGVSTRSSAVTSGRSQKQTRAVALLLLAQPPAIAWDTFLALISKSL
jgi:vancomycin permeability regulator SanA